MLPPPPRIPGLHDLVPLAAGGQGFVYRATRWDEAVVLKVLDPQQTGARERARFEREMATLRGLEHPRIERCFDHGVVRDADSVFDGQPYGVLEYIEGESLAQRRARGHLPLDEVLAIARQLFEALEYLHTRPDGPVVHRDIKPGNLMWTPPSPDTPGALSLIDFAFKYFKESEGQRKGDENSDSWSRQCGQDDHCEEI